MEDIKVIKECPACRSKDIKPNGNFNMWDSRPSYYSSHCNNCGIVFNGQSHEAHEWYKKQNKLLVWCIKDN